MQKIEVLNNITHQHLSVTSTFSADLGDDVVSTVTFVTEFADVQKEYPILCRKAPDTGEYQAVVFFGLQKDENLFLVDGDTASQKNIGWRAEYVPAVMSRGPFSIGAQREIVDGAEVRRPVVHIDVNHAKATCEGGEQLFLKNGGYSPYLNHITTVLDTINDGMYLTKLMFDTFNKYQLLESVALDIEFKNQEKIKIAGFETVNADKLSQLNGEALEELNRSGFLQAAYFIIASMSNVSKLVEWKNRRILAGGAN